MTGHTTIYDLLQNGSDDDIAVSGVARSDLLYRDLRTQLELIVASLNNIGIGRHDRVAIVLPHGGPWVRDTYGYDRWAQMLANRGYAVFQPNYRGSTDLGKSFWMAGDGKWGQEMQNDIEDGMQALVEDGIADPEKLAIFGWSYGGYAAFVAATRNNDLFNCVVSGAGVSDLTRIRRGLSGNRFLRRFQKPTIAGASPVDLAGKVSVPMLIVHGDYDQTVPVEHSRRFVEGLTQAGADHQYIEIEDMGHSPLYFEQNMQWFPELFDFFDTKCGF